jgi:sugar lactone lactonase YvrE
MNKAFTYEVKHTIAVGNHLGESPVWSGERNALFWVDILEGSVFAWNPSTQDLRTWPSRFVIGSIGLSDDANLILATNSGLYLYDLKSNLFEFISHPEAHLADNRFNDGKVSPEGRFWFGSMDNRLLKEKTGCLYCIDGAFNVRKWGDGFKVSNGLAWSPDGTRMYHSCTRLGEIYTYTYNISDGSIGSRQLFVKVDEDWGRPDGAAVDVAGNYWICGNGKGRINCFNPEGELLGYIPTPVPNPTMPCFGGADLKTLYFTTSREGYDAEMKALYPMAGDVFQVELDIAGVPVGKFSKTKVFALG